MKMAESIWRVDIPRCVRTTNPDTFRSSLPAMDTTGCLIACNRGYMMILIIKNH